MRESLQPMAFTDFAHVCIRIGQVQPVFPDPNESLHGLPADSRTQVSFAQSLPDQFGNRSPGVHGAEVQRLPQLVLHVELRAPQARL
jgi:hypothetical protein